MTLSPTLNTHASGANFLERCTRISRHPGKIWLRGVLEASGDGNGLRCQYRRFRIKVRFQNVLAANLADVHGPPPVVGKTQMFSVRRRSRDRLRRAGNDAGLFRNRNTPKIHLSATVTREVKMLTVGRPHRVPVEVGIIGDGDRSAATRRDGP